MHTRTGDNGDAVVFGFEHGRFQLAKALCTHATHPDAPTRARAQARAERWQRILANMVRGDVVYGDRTPLSGVPAWVTLEVATGGFATGEVLAGGALRPHELDALARIPDVAEAHARLALNLDALGDEGLAALQARLVSGDYAIDVPEEGALLVVAWLLANGHDADAHALIDTLMPLFDRLRFYPAPGVTRDTDGTQVHRYTAAQIAARLAARKPQPRLAAQRAAVDAVLLVYDRMIAMALEAAESNWAVPPPKDFLARMADTNRALHDALWADGYLLEGRSKHRFRQLRACLFDYVRGQAPATHDIVRMAQITTDFVRKRGHPDSEAHRAYRAHQQAHVAGIGFDRLAKVVAQRLAAHGGDEGVVDLAPFAAPVSEDEAQRFDMPVGTPIPASVRARLRLCRAGSLRELIADGIVTSGETMAMLLPQLTGRLLSADLDDPVLQRLHGAIYRAFRRRRSLLLLDLQQQVRVQELPWVSVLSAYASPDKRRARGSRLALTEATTVALESFPQAIFPNTLVREQTALSDAAGMNLPWLEELAADIFMGEFSPKYRHAATRAAKGLRGSLYARYYAIDCDEILALPAKPPMPKRSWWTRDAETCTFVEICARRAGVSVAALGRNPASANGMLLEQAQILTTHNLWTAFADVGCLDAVRARLPEMAGACFAWVLASLQAPHGSYHAELIAIKHAAYAWRQMVFYLSWLDAGAQRIALEGMEAVFDGQPSDFRERFVPAMAGLRHAARGDVLSLDAQGPARRVFLGWSVQWHWLREPLAA
jgi:hypothetical protein